MMKILWGLNPFEENPKILKNTAILLKSFAGADSIIPVYVASPLELRIALEFSVPASRRFEEVAGEKMRKVLTPLTGLKLQRPKILVERDPSVTKAVQRFAEYVNREKPDLIVLGTQARRGIRRFFLGSFAESFLHHIDVPVLLVNPRSKSKGRVTRILFPTDFSDASKKAFREFCRFSSWINAKVILHHVLASPTRWASREGYLMMEDQLLKVPQYIERLRKNAQRQAEAWIREVGRKSSRFSVHIEESPSKMSEVILKRAKKLRVDLIAIASQSGQLKSAFLGSTARSVLRNSELPVWVMHPSSKA